MSAVPVRLFHRDSIHARLWCLGQACWFDVEAATANSPSVRVEVFQQPRTETGWPVGLPRLLYEETVPWQRGGEGNSRFARLQFPYRLPPELLGTCHFRLLISTK